MTQRPRRSKRQLYLGVFFVTLAIVVALLRTGFSSGSGSGTAGNIIQYVGLTVEESVDRLGEPTTRIEFYPDEESHADRAALIEKIRRSGQPVPEAFVELAWFADDGIVTLRFPAEFDENGAIIANDKSIDAKRYARFSPE